MICEAARWANSQHGAGLLSGENNGDRPHNRNAKRSNDMKIAEALKKVNEKYGNIVFKPGYPTARLEYMVVGKGQAQKAAAEEFARLGFDMTRSPCGHDYNYGGDLFRLRPFGKETPRR